jgi:hypothetical protein
MAGRKRVHADDAAKQAAYRKRSMTDSMQSCLLEIFQPGFRRWVYSNKTLSALSARGFLSKVTYYDYVLTPEGSAEAQRRIFGNESGPGRDALRNEEVTVNGASA